MKEKIRKLKHLNRMTIIMYAIDERKSENLNNSCNLSFKQIWIAKN